MTISVDDYFRTRKADRKKETRYINVINKDNCTSCNSCATVCPVDCIYEVVGRVPSESYHQIDTSRCIGCQMCYRVPADSTEHYQLDLCPWNAIDMLHNPNVSPDQESVLQPYYRGEAPAESLPWPKLEEYCYQFFLDGEVYLPHDAPDMQELLVPLQQEVWMYTLEDNCRILHEPVKFDYYLRYRATEEGRALLDVIFQRYHRIFKD